MDRCEICKFWLGDNLTDDGEKWTDNPIIGFCRRYPPIKNRDFTANEFEEYVAEKRIKSARLKQIYPITGDVDWCGEFKSK